MMLQQLNRRPGRRPGWCRTLVALLAVLGNSAGLCEESPITDPVPDLGLKLLLGERWPHGTVPVDLELKSREIVAGTAEFTLDAASGGMTGTLTADESSYPLEGTWDAARRKVEIRVVDGLGVLRLKGAVSAASSELQGRASFSSLVASGSRLTKVRKFRMDLSGLPEVELRGRLSISVRPDGPTRGVGSSRFLVGGAPLSGSVGFSASGSGSIKINADNGIKLKFKKVACRNDGLFAQSWRLAKPKGRKRAGILLERRAEQPTAVLLFVSGHTVPGRSESYLHRSAGPYITEAMESVGVVPDVSYFVDSRTTTNAGGLDELTRKCQYVATTWPATGPAAPKVFVIAHSHGGNWARAAISGTGLHVTGLVDLDTNGLGFDASHDRHDERELGRSPKAYFADIDGEPYDLTDVVPDSVVSNLEIHSADDRFDRVDNVRRDGSRRGIETVLVDDDHSGVHETAGDGGTLSLVKDWLLDRLNAPDTAEFRYQILGTVSSAGCDVQLVQGKSISLIGRDEPGLCHAVVHSYFIRSDFAAFESVDVGIDVSVTGSPSSVFVRVVPITVRNLGLDSEVRDLGPVALEGEPFMELVVGESRQYAFQASPWALYLVWIGLSDPEGDASVVVEFTVP